MIKSLALAVFLVPDAQAFRGPISTRPSNLFLTPTQYKYQPNYGALSLNYVQTTQQIRNVSLKSSTSVGDVLAEKRLIRINRLQRSVVAAAACMATWFLTKQTGCSPVRMSSLLGILGCIFMLKPFAIASFCGTFAGMSGQLVNVGTAALLGALCGIVFYWFESGDKLALGKGGRLGTIAFIASLAFYALWPECGNLLQLAFGVLETLRYSTTALVTTSALLLQACRNQSIPSSNAQRLLERVAKTTLLAALITRLLASGTTSVWVFLRTMLAVLVGSVSVMLSDGFVLPAAITGLIGSFGPTIAAPVYCGAFIGMTTFEDFDIYALIQASAVSAALLGMSLFDGFGGKLGFLAFLGVNFAM